MGMRDGMKSTLTIGGGCSDFLIILVAAILVGPWIVQLLWGWVVPDIFAGMVEEGLLLSKLTWWQAFKLSWFVGLLVGASRGASTS